ncbi:major facilitator superfamily domain-containing protein 9-like [Asbolus verrucosus]|uniref:Major facilitator superfamily domain-containing protein 9-like n=1 Tax=Asbolus verrucosus TaxID=1661398 RepID=A0A482VML3_ASBVE|nr:major facilitator superfamily domain-containing protein 9-like [Asbolus verrucosus]
MGAINKIQALMGFAFIFGSLISGHLSEYENGMKYIFALISAGFAVNFGLICLIKDAKVERKKQEKQSFNIFKEISLAAQNLRNVNWPKYWDLFVIKLIIDFSFNVFQFNSGLILLKRFGIVGKSFGYVIATMGIIGIATNLAMMTVKRHLYSKDDSGLTRLLHGNILLIITYLGFGLNTNFSLFIAYLVPMSVARTLIEATFTEVLLGRASPDEKGSIMGTFDSTLSLGGLVAPVLSGVIADSWGEDICLLFCVFPLIFGAILTYSQKMKVQ